MDSQELLALEDRIGNVSTGLSEEAIMKHLKLQKYKSSSQDVEIEPCCICQVCCLLLIISCLFHDTIHQSVLFRKNISKGMILAFLNVVMTFILTASRSGFHIRTCVPFVKLQVWLFKIEQEGDHYNYNYNHNSVEIWCVFCLVGKKESVRISFCQNVVCCT